MELMFVGAACLGVGIIAGYLLAWRNGKAELRAYKDGRLDQHKHQAVGGGSCWVKGQLPPGAHE